MTEAQWLDAEAAVERAAGSFSRRYGVAFDRCLDAARNALVRAASHPERATHSISDYAVHLAWWEMFGIIRAAARERKALEAMVNNLSRGGKVITREEVIDALTAFDALEGPGRHILTLHLWGGMELKQIAVFMQLTPLQVSQIKRTTLHRLRGGKVREMEVRRGVAPPEGWLPCSEAAARYGCTVQWLARLARKGKITAEKCGHQWWFPPMGAGDQVSA